VFGPVCVVNRFESEEEVVGLANDTRYGLNAMLFTENLSRAHRVASRLRRRHRLGELLLRPRPAHTFRGCRRQRGGSRGGNFSREFFTEPKAIVMQIDS
jgi:aminomuconate-semialdehyde/2-hydroxymuconate-6-semialdehyde dehydrogenase